MTSSDDDDDDDDAWLAADGEARACYAAVRTALLEDRAPGGDPVAAVTRLRELMKAGDRDAAFALLVLYNLNEEMRRDRRARRTKAR